MAGSQDAYRSQGDLLQVRLVSPRLLDDPMKTWAVKTQNIWVNQNWKSWFFFQYIGKSSPFMASIQVSEIL